MSVSMKPGQIHSERCGGELLCRLTKADHAGLRRRVVCLPEVPAWPTKELMLMILPLDCSMNWGSAA